MPKDYTGKDVNAEVFLAVLSGNKKGVKHTKGSKKVLDPSGDDEVFVYFADHGRAGQMRVNLITFQKLFISARTPVSKPQFCAALNCFGANLGDFWTILG